MAIFFSKFCNRKQWWTFVFLPLTYPYERTECFLASSEFKEAWIHDLNIKKIALVVMLWRFLSRALIHPSKARSWCSQGGKNQWSLRAAKEEAKNMVGKFWSGYLFTPYTLQTPQLFIMYFVSSCDSITLENTGTRWHQGYKHKSEKAHYWSLKECSLVYRVEVASGHKKD